MFGKLKEKLKSWISGSKEKIEETAEKTVTPIKETSEKKLEVLDKKIKKAEKLIEKAKKEPSELIPTKFDIGKRKSEPDLEKIKQEAESIRKEVKQAKKQGKEVKEFEKEIISREEVAEKTATSGEDTSKSSTSSELKNQELRIPEKLLDVLDKEKIEQPKSFFSKLKSTFSYKISEQEFEEIFEDLEMLLLENNVALEVVEDIKDKLSEKLIGKEINQKDLEQEIKNELKNTLNEILIEPDNPLEIIKTKKPFVILFFGINGTGKTTTIAKIAHFLKASGFSVVLAAGDTFRAASIEQIAEHASKLKVPLIKQNYGSDSAAVGFDAIKYAKNHRIDVVLIDTAGRMHTKANLIEEMKKIERVTNPDLKIFVAESIAGNDATEQARTFNEAIEIDGSILSKADIDDKGGTIISVSHATNKPIFYLGTGQNYEDLELFNKQKFIESLGL